MKRLSSIIIAFIACIAPVFAQAADKDTYLADFVYNLYDRWPDNRMQNLVFHGHSVPTGYFNGGRVMPFDSYPHLVFEGLKENHPYAVINCIRTSIGGENSRGGVKRFASEVLTHRPDVLFIDYSLNDRAIPLEEAGDNWSRMIEMALEAGVKVILLTPTPDTTEDILDPDTKLALYAAQVRGLAEKYHVGLVDSYEIFRRKALAGEDIKTYMSQNNHPNRLGHQLVADAILEWFPEQPRD